jgi:hypothetical protein
MRSLLVKETALSYPLLKYASTHVLEHAEEAQERGIMQTELLQDCKTFERLRHFHNVFKKIPGLGCSKGVRPLYILSHQGCQELLKAKLYKCGAYVNGQCEACDRALQAAASKGEEEIVKMLLAQGADINATGRMFDNTLQAAITRHQDHVVGSFA